MFVPAQDDIKEPMDIVGGETYTPLPGLFLLNPSNRAFVEGRSKGLGRNWGLHIMSMIFLAVAGVIFFVGLNEVNSYNRLMQDGIKTGGLITSHRTSRGRSSTTYYVTFSFDVEVGNRIVRYSKEQSVGSTYYNRYRNGQTVNIKYVPADPNNASIDAPGLPLNSAMVPALIFGAFALIPIGLSLYTILRNGRLARGGRLLQGTLVSARGVRGSKGSYTVYLDFRFTTPEGREIKKTQNRSRTDLKKKPLPASGTPVAVLYVNDKLFQVL